jgi:BioD-like phosphotransacetylase family protein
LDSKVILISSGGVGRPIDEIVLNKALFDQQGVEVLGVIINKILPEKYDKISAMVRKGLERKGINVLGVLPYSPVLARSTFEQIIEETDFKVLCGKDFLESSISKVIVGAMEPREAVNYIVEDSLIITPGDREDIIMTALNCFRSGENKKLKISGLILTGGFVPVQPVMDLLNKAQIPVLLAKADTYYVATTVHDLTVKIRPVDKEKIEAVVKIVKDRVDLDKILASI